MRAVLKLNKKIVYKLIMPVFLLQCQSRWRPVEVSPVTLKCR